MDDGPRGALEIQRTQEQTERDADSNSSGKNTQRRRSFGWLMILPGAIALVILFVLPMVILTSTSFLTQTERLEPGLPVTISNYWRFLGDSFYWGILYRTFKIALMSTAICAILGYPVAMHIDRARGVVRAALMVVVLLPLLISLVVRTLGWMIVMAPGGVLQGVSRYWPFGEIPPLLFTETAIVVGLVHILLPFMVLPLVSGLGNIERPIVWAAEDLGAGRLQIFRNITLPLSLPGLISGSFIVFILAATVFVTPTLLGGSRVRVMAYVVYENNINLANRPFGAAVAIILLTVTVVAVGVAGWLSRQDWRSVGLGKG